MQRFDTICSTFRAQEGSRGLRWFGISEMNGSWVETSVSQAGAARPRGRFRNWAPMNCAVSGDFGGIVVPTSVDAASSVFS